MVILFYCNGRRKRKHARQRDGARAALARDVATWRHWGWRTPHTQTSVASVSRAEGQEAAFGTPDRLGPGLGLSLDERGDAPPPYNPGDKPPSVNSPGHESSALGTTCRNDHAGISLRVLSTCAAPVGPRQLPPCYDESAESSEGMSIPMRPGAVITPSLSASYELDAEAQQKVGLRTREPGAMDRWGSVRKLMSSTGSQSTA
jgi:hypothetical protein